MATKRPRRATPKTATGSDDHNETGHPKDPVAFRWQNFRGFVDTGRLQIKPLTIVLGANNSGKSALMAPLLALKQTMSSSDVSTPLVSKGRLTDIGGFNDFVRARDTSREVTIRLDVHTHLNTGRALPAIGDAPPGGVEIALRAGADPGQTILQRLSLSDIYGRAYFSRERMPDGRYSFSGPMAVQLKENAAHGAIEKILEATPRRFLFPLISPVEWNRDRRRTLKRADEEALVFYSAVIGAASEELWATLHNAAYVGPMRERPKRYYEHTGERPRAVGPRGEFALEVLFRESDALRPKLDPWLSRLGFGTGVRCDPTSSETFSVLLRSGAGAEYNVADCGFGVSQILPILIEGYREQPALGRLLLVKQPEIHLNPKQQCVLGDLFVDLASNGVAVWIETHSEHILLSIRRLVAEGRLPAASVGLYYVERTGVDESVVREIPVRENGHIIAAEWPAGFMDDSLAAALALARAQSRRTRRS